MNKSYHFKKWRGYYYWLPLIPTGKWRIRWSPDIDYYILDIQSVVDDPNYRETPSIEWIDEAVIELRNTLATIENTCEGYYE